MSLYFYIFNSNNAIPPAIIQSIISSDSTQGDLFYKL